MDEIARKKELLKEILQRLQPVWRMAEGFLLLLEGEFMTDAMVLDLFAFCHKAIKNVETKRQASSCIDDMYTKELEGKKSLYDLKQGIISLSNKTKKKGQQS